MATLRESIIEELGTKPTIDAAAEVRARVQFLKDYVRSTPAKGFVLGISGGQDSTLAGALAQRAVAELREEGHEAEFVAVRLPYGAQADESDAQIDRGRAETRRHRHSNRGFEGMGRVCRCSSERVSADSKR